VSGDLWTDLYSYLGEWGKTGSFSFLEVTVVRESPLVVVRWDRGTVRLTLEEVLATDPTGLFKIFRDPDTYYSVYTHLTNLLTQLNAAIQQIFSNYGQVAAPSELTEPRNIEYALGSFAGRNVMLKAFGVQT
jgi:hypothetical protein